MHRDAVTGAGAELVRFARSVGLVRGDWVAIDGSKFLAVSSARSVREREAMRKYLDAVEAGDEQEEMIIDPSVVSAALEKLNGHPEPEARFMRVGHGHAPAYNVQTAVDAEHALVVAHQVTTEATDNRSLLPMAEAAQNAVGDPTLLNVVADGAIPTGRKRKPVKPKASWPTCPPIAPSTTGETEHCMIAPRSSTTRPAIHFAVLPGRP